MPAQIVIWTALPDGIDSPTPAVDPPTSALRLSVLVVPRLFTDGGDGMLTSFPDFVNWPATLDSMAFSVAFGDLIVPASPLPAWRSDVWTELFAPATTRVRAHTFDDRRECTVHSYPAASLATTLLSVYSEAALTFPTEHPPLEVVLDDDVGFGRFRSRPDLRPTLLAELEAGRARPRTWRTGGAPPAVPPGDPHKVDKEYLLFQDFHQLGGDGTIDADPGPPQNDPLDFHQVVAATGQYPALLRLLGLVVDLRIDPKLLAAADGPLVDPEVRVVPSWDAKVTGPGGVGPDRSPSTRSTMAGGGFSAKPRDPATLVAGHLALRTPTYRLLTVDVDGAAIKAGGFADLVGVAAQAATSVPDTPGAYAYPSLRAAGIAVVQEQRGVALVDALDAAAATDGPLVAGDPVVFHAEDLVRGLRFDVWDSTTGWHALMRRTGEYLVGDLPAIKDAGEGYVATVATGRDEPGGGEPALPEKDLYLPEAVMGWSGYSLAASRPGMVIGTETTIEAQDDDPGPDFDIVARFDAEPGTLPVLRFGRAYRVRARVADLAGNGVAFTPGADVDGNVASEEVVYGRFEPVASPPVLLARPRGEGESVERLVIYNDLVQPPEPAVRHIAPPKVTVALAEAHGMFDRVGAGGRTGPDPALYKEIASLDTGGFHAGHKHAKADPRDYSDVFYFPVAPPDELAVDYLADPMAFGAAFRGLPGAGGAPVSGVVQAPFDRTPVDGLPRAHALRFVLRDGSAMPELEPARRELVVSLPPAEVVTVRLSCHLTRDPADLAALGLWHWIKDDPRAGGQVVSAIATGQHWMFTPYRELELVHAVRRPLEPLQFQQPAVQRSKGDTFARLQDALRFHRKSTSRVDLVAAWTEPVDDGPGGPDPLTTTRAGGGLAFSVLADRGTPGPAGDDVLEIGKPEDRHEFGDTKHRVVAYEAVATTRFTEYFVERKLLVPPPALPHTEVLSATGLVPGSVKVKTVDGSHTLTPGVDFTVDEAGGTVTVAKLPVADKSYDVAYLAPEVTRRTKAPKPLSVPSSARPTAPKVLYAVPTFEWSPRPAVGTIPATSRRRASGLRVYLERPWWSSGDGELLGVLLEPEVPQDAPLEELLAYMSTWGADPVFAGPALPSRKPKPAAFPDTVAFAPELLLPEGPTRVAVAAHRLTGWDGDRDLLYCDIDIDTGHAYTPFVRLALARYQPASLPGLELSPVVVMDHAQLTPDRSLTIHSAVPPLPGGGLLPARRVVLEGPSYRASEAGDDVGVAVATVEQKDAAVPDEDLGWTQFGDPVELTARRLLDGVTVRWRGEVLLPATGRRRVVVEQYEVLGEGTRRLLYSDIVEV